jgi:PKD domain
VEPAAIAFGRVREGTSGTQAFIIRSLGTADLIVQEIAIAEGSSPGFELIGSVNTPSVVPTRATNGLSGELPVTIRYTVRPGTVGEQAANVRVRGTDPDRREVLVPVTGQVNRAPIPHIAPLGAGKPGLEVTLDGSGSTDPDGDLPLSYQWSLRKPLGAETVIVGENQQVASMTLDRRLPGEYRVELNVTDNNGLKNLTPARATIVAVPAQKLLVEMFWNNPKPDIDLHFLNERFVPLGTSPGDCFYQNPTPDWGVAGDASDDPEFVHDALTGRGPEVVGYQNPVAGTYRVVAEYKNDQLAENPVTEITVRIYEYGVVKFESKKVLSKVGDVWGVADIDWPSGTITPM